MTIVTTNKLSSKWWLSHLLHHDDDEYHPCQNIIVSTLQTGYPYIQASSQDKLHCVHPHTATCPTALDLACQLSWAPVLPCVLWLRTSRSWLRWAPTLPRALWLRTLPSGRGGIWRCQLSYGSRPYLSVEVGFGAATYPMAPCGPWASSIKKSLAVLPIQLGTHVPNASAQISTAPDKACKTCR
jgi:hypothetical protein